MAYVSQEMKKELTPQIKAICKKYGIKVSIAVHNHSTLVLNIKSGSIDFIGNFNEVGRTTNHRNYGRPWQDAEKSLGVNPYWYHEHFNGVAKSFLDEMVPAMKGPKYFDHSDIQTDYFHCSHYFKINVGQWNKPYVLEK